LWRWWSRRRFDCRGFARLRCCFCHFALFSAVWLLLLLCERSYHFVLADFVNGAGVALDVITKFAQGVDDVLVRNVHLARQLIDSNSVVHSALSVSLSILACFYRICAFSPQCLDKLCFKRPSHFAPTRYTLLPAAF
jgi:hypothetical protein